jgi:glucose-6-phosphate-specific signal transduction histidine kinase
MANPSLTLLHWAPRVLGLGFAVFLGLFALDVFDEGFGFWKTISALLIHLIPTWLVLAGLALAWRWPWAGAVLYAALGVLYLVMAGGRFHWSAYVVISGPLFLIAALFLGDWLARPRLQRGEERAAATATAP